MNSLLEPLFQTIIQDRAYLANLDWGKPRRGHPEGTVRAHIAELEQNLESVREELTIDEYWKLRILIHVHDSFKADSQKGVAITDPNSHASLAKAFLARFSDDQDLLNMVQFHDEPYSLWRQIRHRGRINQVRLDKLIDTILDWDLFLKFLAIDGMTDGKGMEPLLWSANQIAQLVGLRDQVIQFIELIEKSKTSKV